MEAATKSNTRINSSTYYAASKMAHDVHRLLATARDLNGKAGGSMNPAKSKELETLTMALSYARELKESGKPLLNQARSFVGPKLISSSAAAGNKMDVPQILDAAIAELEHAVSAKKTDPKTNIYSAILFKELFEYYVKMKLEAESRGL